MKKIDSFSRKMLRLTGDPRKVWTRQLGHCEFRTREAEADMQRHRVLDTQKMVSADYEILRDFHAATAYKKLMSLILGHVHTAFSISPKLMRKNDYQLNVQLLRGTITNDMVGDDSGVNLKPGAQIELVFDNPHLVLQRYFATLPFSLFGPEPIREKYSCALVMDHASPEIHGAVVIPHDVWDDLGLIIREVVGERPRSLTLGIRGERPDAVLNVLNELHELPR